MSRCFPYPPPGYMRSDSRGVALIEPIELQRENGKAKSELSKEKKRQRREKKEKKESKKRKFFDISNDADKKLSGEKLGQVEKSRDDMNGECILKGKKEAELLESSSLTEEHGMPVSSQNVCYLSDGTQSGKKRKASPSYCNDHPGNIVRIKLNLRKHKEPDAIFSGEQSCSMSGMTDFHVQYKENTFIPDQKQCSSARQSVAIVCGEQSCSTSGRADSNVQHKENTCVPDQKQCSSARQRMAIARGQQSCSTSGMANSHVQYERHTCKSSSAKQSVARLDKEKYCSDLAEVPALDLRTKSKQNKMQKTESLYRDLIQEWLPPPIRLERQENLDDQDWFFGLRRENGNVSKGIAASEDVAQCRSPTLWPRAHYLPEANIYALPFTVPF